MSASRTWAQALRALREEDGTSQQQPAPAARRPRSGSKTRELFVPNSFDVTVPDEGTFRVQASSPEEARQGIVTYFQEDQEGGQSKQIDPGSLQVVRTRKEYGPGDQQQAEAFDGMEDQAWNVRNRKTGQVFSHIPGRTPMDAKNRVISTNPLLRGITALDLAADPMSGGMGIDQGRTAPARQPRPVLATGSSPNGPSSLDNFDDEDNDDDGTTLAGPPRPSPSTTATTGAQRPSSAKIRKISDEGVTAGAMGSNGPMGRDQQEAFRAAVRNMVREVVRKKVGGGGYALYAPNKGKKKSPKPVGEFPTRLAAKNAELARFPPKDPEQLKKMRSRLDKIKKDPEKRASAERADLSGRKKAHKSGAPARDRKKRKESLVRLMTRDLHERLFHEDEVPGSPWDEKIASLHPDAISSDRRLHALHRGIEKASIGALGDAHRGLTKCLRGMARVNPGDIAHDPERNKTFMPVMMDCDGFEIGPVHLYVDGGHVKVEVSREARDAISQLEPDTARDIRGGLMSFEEDHLPRIDGAQKAWAARDGYLDKLHGRLERHAAGLSGVEHHLMKGLLVKGGKGK